MTSPVVFTQIQDISFLPALIAYFDVIRRTTGARRLIVCHGPWDGSRYDPSFINFKCEDFEVLGGGALENELKSFLVNDDENKAPCILLIWNHEANTLWQAFEGESASTLASIIKNNRASISFYLYSDGWIGESWMAEHISKFSRYAGIELSDLCHIFLKNGAHLDGFREAGIKTIVASSDSCSASLTLCCEHAYSVLGSSFAKMNTALGSDTLVICMRPWFTKEFHNLMYDFGTADPIESNCRFVASILKAASSLGVLSSTSSVLLCPDYRTDHFFSASRLQDQLSVSLQRKVESLRDYIPEEINYITLDYVLPLLMRETRVTLISFDSNTTVPLHLAGLKFASLHGATLDFLQESGASTQSIDYIRGNVQRVIGYADPAQYSTKMYDSSCFLINSLGVELPG